MEKFEEIYLRNEAKFYLIFFEIMILLMIIGFRVRGYFACGGETLLMLIPAAYSIYIRSKN